MNIRTKITGIAVALSLVAGAGLASGAVATGVTAAPSSHSQVASAAAGVTAAPSNVAAGSAVASGAAQWGAVARAVIAAVRAIGKIKDLIVAIAGGVARFVAWFDTLPWWVKLIPRSISLVTLFQALWELRSSF